VIGQVVIGSELRQAGPVLEVRVDEASELQPGDKRIDPVGDEEIQRFLMRCAEQTGKMRSPTANLA